MIEQENKLKQQESVLDDKNALVQFLLDIDCLSPLSKYINGVNVFDVLKITKNEIRHSNMLAWLFNPNENHGLQDNFIRGVFQCLVENTKSLQKSIFRILMADFYSFNIYREYKNIDILLVSQKEKIVLCIENKIDSSEHDNQLSKYKSAIENEFKGSEWLRIFAYLTADGEESSDSDNWLSLSYKQIADILDHCLVQNELIEDSRMIIEHYLKILRRNIVMDEELVEICNRIYATHQRALDLIFENRQDICSVVYGIIIDWCEEKKNSGEIIFDKKNSCKTCIRFTTPKLNILYPFDFNLDDKPGWGNHPVFYEINNRSDRNNNVILSAVCSVSIEKLSQELNNRTRDICKNNNIGYEEKNKWKRICSLKAHNIQTESEQGLFINKDKIIKYLDDDFNKLKEFETKAITLCNLNK